MSGRAVEDQISQLLSKYSKKSKELAISPLNHADLSRSPSIQPTPVAEPENFSRSWLTNSPSPPQGSLEPLVAQSPSVTPSPLPVTVRHPAAPPPALSPARSAGPFQPFVSPLRSAPDSPLRSIGRPAPFRPFTLSAVDPPRPVPDQGQPSTRHVESGGDRHDPRPAHVWPSRGVSLAPPNLMPLDGGRGSTQPSPTRSLGHAPPTPMGPDGSPQPRVEGGGFEVALTDTWRLISRFRDG